MPADIKIAGRLPGRLPAHMMVPFARYSRDQTFSVLAGTGRFLISMTAGSITGTLLGALLLGVIPNLIVIPDLALLLLLSAIALARLAPQPVPSLSVTVGPTQHVATDAGARLDEPAKTN